MSKKPATTAALADPTSDRIVVAYTPGDRSARNVSAPARHLTAADVARLAYVEAVRRVGGNVGQPVDPERADGPRFVRPDPRTPDQALVAEIVARLEATGLFTTDPDAVAAAIAETSPATPADTTPAESAADTTEG